MLAFGREQIHMPQVQRSLVRIVYKPVARRAPKEQLGLIRNRQRTHIRLNELLVAPQTLVVDALRQTRFLRAGLTANQQRQFVLRVHCGILQRKAHFWRVGDELAEFSRCGVALLHMVFADTLLHVIHRAERIQ